LRAMLQNKSMGRAWCGHARPIKKEGKIFKEWGINIAFLSYFGIICMQKNMHLNILSKLGVLVKNYYDR